MFQVRGFFLPDGETHLVPLLRDSPEFAGGPTYQLHKLLGCLPHVKNFRRAIDIGGHCGLWSRPMATMFRHVESFEPVDRHRECFLANLHLFPNVTLYPFALGSKEGKVALHTGPSSSGDTYVKVGGEHGAEMRTLDSFKLEQVDFIKIDCEGYEFMILKGAIETVRKQKPFVIVEQKPGKAKQFGIPDTAACSLLEDWGAKRVFEYSGDYGYRFP